MKKDTELTSMEAAELLVAHGYFKVRFKASYALMVAVRRKRLPSRREEGLGRTPHYFEKPAVIEWAQNRNKR